MLQKASEEVRAIVMNLRPSILDNLGILATINWFCRQYEGIYTGIRIEKTIHIRERDVPDHLKTAIFRILQEAFNNIAKHSNAREAHLALETNGERIELAVRDNGRGFDAGARFQKDGAENGFGITGMKERVELSGGVFSIQSAPGDGACVRASWPIG
jgi:signal transduction histidine kinase